MSSSTTTCPYCNAELADPTRGLCTRCGEKLPGAAATTASSDKPVEQNRRTRRQVLALMGVIALVTVGFVLWTVQQRRQRDLPNVKLEAHPLPQPQDFYLLGFMPPRCGVIGHVQMRQFRGQPQGRELLASPLPGWAEILIGKVHDILGLSPGQIDQFALGILGSEGLPKIFIVVETMGKLDVNWFENNRSPRMAGSFRRGPVYQFREEVPPMGGMIYLATERRAVIVLSSQDATFDDLTLTPELPRDPKEGFDAALLPIFGEEQRIDKESVVWLAGKKGALGSLESMLALAAPKLSALGLAQVYSAGLSFTAAETVLRANFFTGDAAKSAALQETLEGWPAPPEGLKRTIVGAPAGAPAAEQWITLQIRGPARAFRN